MKISILLPYKENFSPTYAGAVSIFINDTLKISKFKKNTIVYGNTKYKEKFNTNYVNLNYSKSIIKSTTKSYISEFLKKEKASNSNIIEFHNRPSYLKYLTNIKYAKIIKLIVVSLWGQLGWGTYPPIWNSIYLSISSPFIIFGILWTL